MTGSCGGPTSPGTGLPGDGLDGELWERLSDIMAASSSGDANAFTALLASYNAEIADEKRSTASAYVTYILRFLIIDPLHRRPTGADLRRVADQIFPRYAMVVRAPADLLEATLRAVFQMPQPRMRYDSAQMFVSAVAAVGVL
jgi:hypothetical protein